LDTVLADVENRGVKNVVCLGDVIGYGPRPLDSLDRVREKCLWSLMGNHDFGVMYEPTHFNAGAEAAVFWTRRQFEMESDKELRALRWKFLGSMLIRQKFGDGFMVVHGSPRHPISEYVFPDDVTVSPKKMRQIFELIERACLVGHTHVQGVFTDEPDFYTPGELGNTYRFNDDEKVLINVGSVGQPRDRDPRSGYVILHEDHVEFVRIEYDIPAVVKQIEEIPELNEFFGQRLLEGR